MPSVSIPSIVTAGASLAGGLISSNGAQSAANTQAQAAEAAQQTQLQMYNQTRSDLQPFMNAGSSALGQLANIFGFGTSASGTTATSGSTSGSPATGTPNASAALSQLTQMPGYQFGLDQGTQALDRSAASRGLDLSGAQLKDAQTYGQGYAQQQAWAPYVSELNSVSGLGENAAAGVGNAGVTTGQGVASSQLAAGQATAAGQVAAGNTLGQATTQLLSGLGSSYGASGLGSVTQPAVSYATPITATAAPLQDYSGINFLN